MSAEAEDWELREGDSRKGGSVVVEERVGKISGKDRDNERLCWKTDGLL